MVSVGGWRLVWTPVECWLVGCVGLEHRLTLYSRIGFLSIFNPMRPDGYYRLDLSVREEHLVATILIHLALKEPGENMREELYEDEKFQAPTEWLTNMPTEGAQHCTIPEPPPGHNGQHCPIPAPPQGHDGLGLRRRRPRANFFCEVTLGVSSEMIKFVTSTAVQVPRQL